MILPKPETLDVLVLGDLGLLESLITEMGGVSMVIIDPPACFMADASWEGSRWAFGHRTPENPLPTGETGPEDGMRHHPEYPRQQGSRQGHLRPNAGHRLGRHGERRAERVSGREGSGGVERSHPGTGEDEPLQGAAGHLIRDWRVRAPKSSPISNEMAGGSLERFIFTGARMRAFDPSRSFATRNTLRAAFTVATNR